MVGAGLFRGDAGDGDRGGTLLTWSAGDLFTWISTHYIKLRLVSFNFPQEKSILFYI